MDIRAPLIVGYAAVAAACSDPIDETAIHVAASGSDDGDGTAQAPVRSLARAQQLVRERTATMTEDIVVEIADGTYPLDAPLRLSTDDSGRGGHRVIYQARGYGTPDAETVVISGGRAITGWQRVAGSDVWQADVGDLETRQLVVAGAPAPRAHHAGGLPGTVIEIVTETVDGDEVPVGYHTDSAEPQAWTRPEDVELVYVGAFGYADIRCGVAAISADPRGTTITMDQPCFRWTYELAAILSEEAGDERDPGLPSYGENSPAFLASPGSWYLDRSAPGHHVLSYVAGPGEDPRATEIIAPVLETLLAGDGVHDVAIRGLTFTHATWLAPSQPTGFVNVIGSSYYAPTLPSADEGFLTIPGNVSFERAERVAIEGNRFTQLGAQALTLVDSTDVTVAGNVATDVSGGGIEATSDPGRSRDVRIVNNWIHHIGTDYRSSMGIAITGLTDTTVAHNQVDDTPYSGIVVLPGGRRIDVVANHVFDNVNVIFDGGGIYVNDTQGPSFADGTVVRDNVVHGVRNPFQTDPEIGAPNALYIDWYADHVTALRNVLYDNHNSLGGVEPQRVRFLRNFWDDDRDIWYRAATSPDRVTIELNTPLFGDPEHACRADATCAAILAGAGLEPAYRRLIDAAP